MPFMARGHASSGVAFDCQVSLASFHLFFVSSKFSFVFMTFTSWKRTGPSGCGTKGPPAVPGTQLAPNTCYHGLSAYCVPDSSCTFSHSSLQQLSEGHVVGLPPLCTRGDRLGRVRGLSEVLQPVGGGPGCSPQSRAPNHRANVSWGIFLVFYLQVLFL